MKNPSPKKPTAKKGVPSLPYQEPHLGASARGKLLEEAIGREVRGFREKLGITISELGQGGGHVGRHVVQDREWSHIALAQFTCRP